MIIPLVTNQRNHLAIGEIIKIKKARWLLTKRAFQSIQSTLLLFYQAIEVKRRMS